MKTRSRHPRNLTGLAALAALSTAFPLAGVAQDAASPVLLDTVTIDGGLSPIATDAYGRAYSIVEGEEMRSRATPSLRAALTGLPGVSVSETGLSFGSIRMRGAPANHTLVLVDGVEARGGGEAFILSGMGIGEVERLEILRGPQSVFFGSRASAGVVNIITRRSTEPGTGGEIRAMVGDGYDASAFAYARGAQGGVSLSYGARDDHGYDASGKAGEKDGSRRRSLTLSGDWQATETLRFGLTQSQARETYGYDNSDYLATGEADYMQDIRDLNSKRDERIGQVFAEFDTLDGRLTHRLSYERSRYAQDFPGDFPYQMLGVTRALKYRASLSLDGVEVEAANHLLNIMAEQIRWSESATGIAAQEKSTDSVALEYRGFYGNGLDVQAGIRRDNNKGFRDFTSWNLGLSKDFGNGLRLHASAGAGMTNPTFTELFGYPGWSVGNPDLSPEVNRSIDIGLAAETADGRGQVDVTLFREKLTDMISSGSCATGFCSVNVAGDTVRRGVEIAGSYALRDNFSLRGSYSYIDVDQSDGARAVYIPRHEAVLGASYQHGQGTVGADLRHVAGVYAPQGWVGGTTAELPDFTTLDLYGDYALNDRVKLVARVENVFDTETKEAWGYGWRGRSAQIGFSTNW